METIIPYTCGVLQSLYRPICHSAGNHTLQPPLHGDKNHTHSFPNVSAIKIQVDKDMVRKTEKGHSGNFFVLRWNYFHYFHKYITYRNKIARERGIEILLMEGSTAFANISLHWQKK